MTSGAGVAPGRATRRRRCAPTASKSSAAPPRGGGPKPRPGWTPTAYANLVVDNHPVAFIGFPQVAQTDPAGTTTRSQWYAVADSTAPENGLAYHTEVQIGPVIRSTQDHLYDLTTTTPWGTKPVPLTETRRSSADETPTTRYFRTTYQYDSYGNPSQTIEYGEVASTYTTDLPGDERTTSVDYRYKTSATIYLVDRPIQRSVYSGSQVNEASLAARTRFYYDNLTGWPDNVLGEKGQLTQELVWTGTAWVTTRYAYDSLGNPTGVTDPNNNTTTTSYDNPTYRGFATRVVRPRPGGTLTTQTDYDFTRLVVSRVYDADNQDATSYEYDSWGRLIKVIRPGESAAAPTVEYQYTAGSPLSTVTTWARESAGNARDTASTRPSIAFYDGLGRLLETKVEAPTGSPTFNQFAVTRSTYNTRGLVETVTQPFFDGQPLTTFVGAPAGQPVTQTSYDGLGQVKTVTEPTNRVTTHNYAAGIVQVIDPLGRAVNRKTDGLGRLTEVWEYTGTGTPSAPYQLSRQTSYRYTAVDLLSLVETKNSTGSVLRRTTIGYDQRGLKTSLSDPDMGTWQYRYDAAGNLIQQANSRTSQNVTCLYYDSLNRLKGRTFQTTTNITTYTCPADPGNNNYSINYAYENLPGYSDALTKNGYGRLRSVWYGGSYGNPQIAHNSNYDDRGRVQAEGLVTAQGSGYALLYAYDSMDRLTQVTYPDGEVVQTTYTAMGPPKTLKSTTYNMLYVTNADYTALGAPSWITFLNGTRSDYSYYNQSGDQSQRLKQLKVTKSGTVLLDLNYSYDAVSNLTGLTDATPNRTESLTYGYDAFNRLTSVSGGYSASYAYDPLDRLTTFSEGTYTTTFGFWSAGSDTNTATQPRHAPKYIGSASYAFVYDPAGNMTTRWLKQGTSYIQYTQAFNPDNRLYQVTGNGATLTYDLDPQSGTTLRRSQTSGGSTTTTDFVLHYYQKNVTTGEVTKYYYFGGQRVLQRVGATGLSYLHSDHLGSPALLTSSSGTVQTRYRFAPYGRQREGSPTTDRRFTGQRWEASSFLYDYQARHYDPALGLFVSPDPIVPEPGQPAALNRYSYALNNPVRYTDPTGHAVDAGGAICGYTCLYLSYKQRSETTDPTAYGGALQEYLAAKAVLYYNLSQGDSPANIAVSAAAVEATDTALAINGYYGQAEAFSRTWEVGGIGAAAAMVQVGGSSNTTGIGGISGLSKQLKAIWRGGTDSGWSDTVSVVRALKPGGGVVDVVSVNGVRSVPSAIQRELQGRYAEGTVEFVPRTITVSNNHAEIRAYEYIRRRGYQALEVDASVGICPACARASWQEGAIPVSPLRKDAVFGP
ncbi:MAG TPA: hypothetical protein DEP84_30955 [Chloroflexi bacterium]|nr:hypothetical protein [Chloroflexota bacterium]